ncbi:MAG: putative Glycosyl transferase, group 1 [Deltaproteobacteria bacterium]|nr:putative Glycosyl transferase, group 1 [Deltaproteobacteria bacterium]
MKICMVLYDPQEFGGLEEYVTTLAIGLQQRGQQVSVLFTTWVPPDNQYVRRLRQQNVRIVQLPKRLSHVAAHWPTKEKIVTAIMRTARPLVYALGGVHFLLRKRPWQQSLTSSHNWLRGQLMNRVIGPDRRRQCGRLLLNWWRWRWRPDLLHVHGYATSLLFVVDWAHAKNLPVVYEEHQTPDAQFDWWQGFERTINKATMVVAVSETSAEGLRAVCGVTRPIAVRPPLLPDPMASGWQKEPGPQRYGTEPLHVTTVARLYVTKGLVFLLEAIARVLLTYPLTQFRVYGDGPLRAELLAHARRLGLDGNALFVGAFTDREELARIMNQTDIFVMSSVLEGQPLGLVEAMAYGCPIVATSVGGIPELIENGVNGLLCAPGDSECLAAKIRSLIEDPVMRTRLGTAARRAFEQGPFQPASVCSALCSIYDNALRYERPTQHHDRVGSA